MKKPIVRVCAFILCLITVGFILTRLACVRYRNEDYVVTIQSVSTGEVVSYVDRPKTFYETNCVDKDGNEVIVTSSKLYEYSKDNIGSEISIRGICTYYKDRLISYQYTTAIIYREVPHAIPLDSVVVKETIND